MTTVHDSSVTTVDGDLSVWPASTTELRPGDLAVSLRQVRFRSSVGLV
ncbi:hypothetical protein AB0N07_47145 [Streptomyces sp. NPDC051172]